MQKLKQLNPSKYVRPQTLANNNNFFSIPDTKCQMWKKANMCDKETHFLHIFDENGLAHSVAKKVN